MIKLIVADMDGTLLTDSKELPPHFDETIHELHRRKIRFAIGSGRQYQTLRQQFESLADDMIFFSDNGTFVYEYGQCVYTDVMANEDVDEAIRRLQDYDVFLIVSGSKGAYHLPTQDPATLWELHHYYKETIEVDNLLHLDDQLGKIAVLDLSEKLELENLFDDIDSISIVKSGPVWFDVMKTGTNKGLAVKTYQEINHITQDETVIFGDYMNDYEMLQQATYSFAMANAVDKIKEISNFEALSNNDYGVTKVIDDILEGSFEDKWKK